MLPESLRTDPSPALLALAVLTTIVARPSPALAHDVAAEMAEAAQRFVTSLDDAQRQKALFEFDSQKRTFWHYVPTASLQAQGGRPGLSIKEMTPEQRALAHGLLNTALSHKGYLQSMTIMTLETILRDLEGGSAVRDPEMYHLSIYGKPSTQNTWAWCFEGHHLSVHLTLVEGQRFSVTPSFFGSNPAQVKEGRFQGLETLPAEQHLARELVRSFSAEQRRLAVIAEKAPRDIVTRAEPKIDRGQFQPPQGIPFEKLDAKQRQMLLDLVRVFTEKYRPEIIAQIDERKPIADGRGMVFAWAGGLEPGEGHYYRVQTPEYLFEYDNTQAGANHVHAVWRQFDGDFGEDLLRRHYETSPHHRQ